MKRRMHLTVRGRVQGVCYRMDARDEAQRLGVAGWVRNCPDGSVELLAEGEEEALAELLAWCRQGPPAAYVSGVEETYAEAAGALEGFRIVH